MLVVGLCGALSGGAATQPEPEDLRTDRSLIAIARYQDVPVLAQIDRAWRAVHSEQSIVPVPTGGMACLNELYGME